MKYLILYINIYLWGKSHFFFAEFQYQKQVRLNMENIADSIKNNWENIKKTIKSEFELSDTSYRTWVEPLKFYKQSARAPDDSADTE